MFYSLKYTLDIPILYCYNSNRFNSNSLKHNNIFKEIPHGRIISLSVNGKSDADSKKLMENVKSTGLTLGQPKVLDYLKHHDGANQKEIAAGCHIEAGSLTSILNRMEEKI